MFALIALVLGGFFVFGVVLVIALAVMQGSKRRHQERLLTRQFEAARWWKDNRDGLKRLGVDEHEFKQERWGEPYKPDSGDINPPPRPDRRQRSTWVERDFPDPPQRFA